MLVLAAVRDLFAHRVERAARAPFRLMRVRTWDAALSAILRHPVEIGFLDPALEGPPRAQEIERLKVLFPSLSLLAYTSLAPALAPVLLALGEAGVRHIVLANHDDHPERLYSLLVSESSRSVSKQLLHAFDDLLADWPPALRVATEAAVREPADFQSVAHLADRAGMSRRTCARWFAKARLPPPHETLTVLRVVYAHRLLQDPGYTVEDVAQRLGYSQTRSFAENVKEVLGMTPSELRVSLSPIEAVAIVRERYFGGRAVISSLASAS
jgi:AraC-like DNA-binding protein